MDTVKVAEAEIAAFLHSGRPIHLAHAIRALMEICKSLKQSPQPGDSCESHQERSH
jgi:hypothetical protein